MSILCDTQIRELVGIEPFEENVKRPGRVSYGVSSYGYDVRVGPIFKIFTNASPTGGQTVVDPKDFGEDMFVTVDTDKTGRDHVIIPPNSFALAATVEVMRIPRDVLAVCLGKCVTGDTRVVDAETGEYLPIREFAGRGRTVGLDGWRAATPAVADFVPQGRQKVYELRTRAGPADQGHAEPPVPAVRGVDADVAVAAGRPHRRRPRGAGVRPHSARGVGGGAAGPDDLGGPVPHPRPQPRLHF